MYSDSYGNTPYFIYIYLVFISFIRFYFFYLITCFFPW